MSKLYNNYYTVVNSFYSYFNNFTNSKTLLNFLPHLFCSLINSESITSSKVALNLFSSFNPYVKLDSHLRRIHRFLNNNNYIIHTIFDDIVDDVLSKYKLSHDDNNIHISFDHMFTKENFTTLMFTLRVGRQGIPIYFKTYDGKHGDNHGDAFRIRNIKNGILYCHNLIKKYLPNSNIIFLADRWFGNLFPLMNYIDSLNDTFVMRCKSNMLVYYTPYNESHKIWMPITDLPHYVNHSALYNNLEFTRHKYIYNLAYCKSKDHKESWLLITNGDPKYAKACYGYRFGSIEFLFKSQKTNGFYLEETGIKNIHAFDNLYSLVCIANLYLTCLGTDISKNKKCYKNIGFRITRKDTKTNSIKRCISRFRAGLNLFKMAINCPIKFRLPITFILYDS